MIVTRLLRACYATVTFQALLSVATRHPNRQMIILNQSCLSEGHARFLFHAPFLRRTPVLCYLPLSLSAFLSH